MIISYKILINQNFVTKHIQNYNKSKKVTRNILFIVYKHITQHNHYSILFCIHPIQYYKHDKNLPMKLFALLKARHRNQLILWQF